MAEKSSGSHSTPQTITPNDSNSMTPVQIFKNLPLELIKSETIPPSPNRFDSSIDWLPDFSGLSWIGYGASSLLVISHFPSPLSHEETLIGPVYRQVIELSNDESSVVKSVAWSPVVPSEGEVAVAVENCICLCSESSRSTKGIFCWVQSGVLLQSNQVEAIKWTGSGDGIISVGINVVLWKRKSKTWEIAWKLKVEQPQTMVSATWSTEGPVATGVRSDGSSFVDGVASGCVLVCQNDEKFRLVKVELRHPRPVLMIQWRPHTGKHSQRDILLTCCLDGTVRLWSEIGSGRGKKIGKDMNDVKGTRQLFYVIAVIEINQSIDGTLGTDTFVVWAAEMKDMVSRREGIKQCPSIEGSEDGTPAKCEWLIGYGPGTSLTFWAIHCLDDISPLRFPRVTLWKRLQLQGVEEHVLQNAYTLNSKCHSLLVKATISRSLLYSPPIECSLFQLFSNNCMSWSQQSLDSSDTKSELLTLDGHTGHLIQVAVHPYSSEVELAASLDSNGVLLFWSLSTISSCMLGIPPLVLPTWKLLGKMVTGDWASSEYSSFKWAPSVLEDYSVLLMGHAGGIDCFMIKISEVEVQKIMCHKLCTIPFTDHSRVDGPTNIFAIPLPCTCRKTFVSNNFMLLGIWMKNFQALSWSVTLHSDDLSGSPCDCISSAGGIADYGTWRYEIILDGKKYSVVAVPGSSKLPDPQIHDQVTSVAVVSPGNMIPSIQQKLVPSDSLSSVAYHMATGCSDGSLKLWRNSPAKSSASQSDMDYLSWELLGTLQAHQGPVSAIALSCCGRKIATICTNNHLDSVSTLCIWETVHVRGEGNFLLEDSISLNETIIAVDWLSIGNGQLLLGVCMQNELRIYAERTYDEKTNVKSGETLGTHIWYCIAFGPTSLDTRDFLWGPGATPVLVHKRYFCLFSKWSFRMNKRHHAKCYAQRTKINSQHSIGGTEKDIFCENFIDINICDINGLSLDEKSEKGTPILPSKINMRSDHPICNVFSTMTQHQYDSGMKTGCWNMLEVAERLRGTLPIYHPEALLMNLYSGNSRRACAAVRHLVENLTTSNTFVTHEKTSGLTRPNRIIPQMLLSKYFEEPYSTSLGDDSSKLSRDSFSVMSASQFQSNPIQFNGYSSDTYTFTSSSVKSEISGFVKTIEEFHDITAITRMDKIQLFAILDLLSEVSGSHSGSPYESLDEPGRRFWVAVRFQQLIFFQRFGRMVTMDEFVVDSSLMGWASHSDCQDNLFSSFLSTEPSWQEMRNLGVGFWFTNASQLRTRMEKLARAQYLKKKDPKDCALLYIALNRVQVLAGLFKISRDEKDKPLVGFLSRNFQDKKNKAAALKNAYVLMGRHQLDLAIAFFLLGGDTSSAVTICAKNLGDEQLALVLCRLIEGYGGPLENYLISRILLPAATEKGDHWLASLLEWAMGNYSQSFLKLLGFQHDSLTIKSILQCNQAAFLDPKVGQYGLVLATKNVMKNSVGEFTAATFARWVTLMTSIALNRCGLPVESLECLSSSLSTLETKDERSLSEIRGHEVVDSNPSAASNWLSGDVALHLESCYKLDLASQYISKLTMEHPSWPENNLASGAPLVCNVDETCQRELPLETFKNKLYVGIRFFEQKYLINSVDLTNMIFVFSSNNGLLFTGYHILHACTLREHPQDENHVGDGIYLYPPIVKLILKATEEISCLFARYLVSCSMSSSLQGSSSHDTEVLETDRSSCFNAWDVYIHAFVYLVKSLGLTLEIYYPNFLEENLIGRVNTALELIEYYVLLASAWRQKNLKVLILMIHPILLAYTDGYGPSEINIRTLKKKIHQNVELMICDSLVDVGRASVPTSKQLQHEESGHVLPSIPEDERWLVIGACLWRLLFNFTKDQLKAPSDSMGDENSSSIPSLKSDNIVSSDSDVNTTVKLFQQVPVFLAMFLKRSLAFSSSYHVNQLGSCLCKKVKEGFLVPTLSWIEESNQSQPKSRRSYLNHGIDSLQLINNAKGSSLLEILWEMTADPKAIREEFLQEKICWSLFGTPKPSKVWTDIQKAIGENENGDFKIYGQGSSVSNNSGSDGGGKLHSESEDSKEIRSSKQNSTTIKDSCCFQSPEEIYKTNGELLEAICINSIDRQQAALASNRKGILFFDWKDKKPSGYQSEYIWSDADWPQNGWAGSESTPVPTFVSPGIGLGSKKGTHLGLGGATIGLGSSVRPGRDLTGGGAFGIPGYAGIDAAGLGWGTQEDFDESVDPPATIDNISTRTLSSHPSRPFFLAGSSNTHVYLWEFGKEKATATYGVLPAANVPPPYALASISALQFDRYGHRFVTAASDGTICTWQLEVGGRSNIHPTESSLCFKNHALDVTYVAGSGSIIAAAGYSSNDVNVVIWDTLAPAATSQASLICHEGGARSVSVFDNDIGSGSVSPLIVTGGRNGDVGLHDFRFIATGKTKRQRQSNTSQHETHLGTLNKHGEQNSKGMLWYIPKAHLGSVTRIATIPHTSLFLTGSKDGDVKLWDAKRAELIFHWPKLHERHTFLQPSTRGFGGVVRAAVTDIQVLSHGFLSCGGDGTVKRILLKDSVQIMREK